MNHPARDPLVFYASDLDGDRHLFANVPVEQAVHWQVTFVRPGGVREPGGPPTTGFAGSRSDRDTPRVCWFADREPGSWYEFVLPDGSAFTAWADGNRVPAPPPQSPPTPAAAPASGRGGAHQQNLSPEVERERWLSEPTGTQELAEALDVAVEEFVETFGDGWQQVRRFHDYDADPTGGQADVGDGAFFSPWYVAGHPAQIMMRLTDDHLEIATPKGTWYGHMLAWEACDVHRFPVRLWDRPHVRDAVAEVLADRRATFGWCRYCHALTAPEDLHQPTVCMGCATRHLGLFH